MLEGRLPSKVIHQYMPVDRMPYVEKFLDHWHPDFVLWIEIRTLAQHAGGFT